MDNALALQLIQYSSPSLVSLTLRSKSLNDETLKSMVLAAPNVNQLQLMCPSVTEDGLSSMLELMKDRLKGLQLATDCVGRQSILAIASIPTLQYLGMFPKSGVGLLQLIQLEKQKLRMSKSGNIGTVYVIHLLHRFPLRGS
jgi:hypothetical protein